MQDNINVNFCKNLSKNPKVFQICTVKHIEKKYVKKDL